MTTNFIGTLLTNSPTYTVTSGFSTLLYDAYGAQTVSVSPGASLSLVGAMGANNIRLHGNADAWQVMRSGSTTIFIHTNGDRVEIPAIVDQQSISFDDQSAALRIETTGNIPVVKLGTQAISTTASAITAWGEANPDDPAGSSELAPWTLVMKHGATTFVSDGSAIGTLDTDVPQGPFYQYVTTPDLSKALAYGGGQGIWSISSSENASQVTETDFLYNTWSQLHVITYGSKVGFFHGYGSTAVVTDGIDAQVSNLDFGLSYGSINTESGDTWTTFGSVPYGSELGQIVLTDSGLESRFVKDINPGQAGSVGYSLLGAALPDGRLIFGADDGSGYEPWVSDGTELGTFRLADFSRYFYGSAPSQFFNFNNQVAFTANLFGDSGDVGRVVVLTDGTTEGTTWVDPIDGSNDSSSILGIVNDQIYMLVYENGTNKIYVTNGINASYLATISGDASLIAWTEQIAYFSASDSAHGTELWALPLNGSGTLSLVKDILVGTGSALSGYNLSSFLVGDKLAFTAYSTAVRESFYLSDGTSAGTVQLSTYAPSPLAYQIVGTALYFSDTSGTYYVDTSLATPSSVRIGATSSYLQSDDDQAYFLANQDLYVIGVEESTPTLLAEGVAKVKVFQEDALYFIQQGSGGVLSLWYSDGTANGTRYIEDLPTNYLFGYDLDNAVAIRTVGVNDPPL